MDINHGRLLNNVHVSHLAVKSENRSEDDFKVWMAFIMTLHSPLRVVDQVSKGRTLQLSFDSHLDSRIPDLFDRLH